MSGSSLTDKDIYQFLFRRVFGHEDTKKQLANTNSFGGRSNNKGQIITLASLQSDKDVTDIIAKYYILDILNKQYQSSVYSTYYLNPNNRYKRIYILLDTANTNAYTFKQKYLVWNITNSSVVSRGTVNVIGDIANIIGMRIYPVKFPLSSITQRQYALYTITVNEFISQSFIVGSSGGGLTSGGGGYKYHFMLDSVEVSSVNNGYLTYSANLMPRSFGRGYYWFKKPVTSISTLSISFGNPFQILLPSTFQMMWFANLNTPSGSPVSFSVVGQDGNLVPSGLTTGDIIIIGGLPIPSGSSSGLIDAINQVNSIDGNIVTVTGSSTFTIAVDLTGYPDDIANSITVTFINSSIRTIIPLELICKV